jgi:hypothetical protein
MKAAGYSETSVSIFQNVTKKAGFKFCFVYIETSRKYGLVIIVCVSEAFSCVFSSCNRLCGLVVRVPGYRYRGRVRFPTLTHFLRSGGPGTGSTQPREYNCGAIWKKRQRLRSRNPTLRP